MSHWVIPSAVVVLSCPQAAVLGSIQSVEAAAPVLASPGLGYLVTLQQQGRSGTAVTLTAMAAAAAASGTQGQQEGPAFLVSGASEGRSEVDCRLPNRGLTRASSSRQLPAAAAVVVGQGFQGLVVLGVD